MRSLIRPSILVLLLLTCSVCVFAGGGILKPARSRSVNLYRWARQLDSLLASSVREPARNSGTRICSCQVLNLESSNYHHQHIAVLAERTNDGTSRGYRVAGERIEKEKKLLKTMFYDKVKLVHRVVGNTSCSELFVRLKMADHSLQLYDILNADIRF
jgi:hypothetical protein